MINPDVSFYVTIAHKAKGDVTHKYKDVCVNIIGDTVFYPMRVMDKLLNTLGGAIYIVYVGYVPEGDCEDKTDLAITINIEKENK